MNTPFFRKPILIISSLLVICTTFAQQNSIYTERIAISHDGNLADCDDIGALAWNYAILWSFGATSQLVHLDYADNLNPDEPSQCPNQYAEIKKSATEGPQHFPGFDAKKVFDVQTDLAGAIANFKAEADASGPGNRLTLIIAGPAEVPWRLINAVEPDKRPYLQCISHGAWNAKYYSDNNMTHSLATLKADFPTVKFIDLVDQNDNIGKRFPGIKTSWDFLHSMPTVCGLNPSAWEWLKSRDLKNGDVSDIGLTWYLLTGNDKVAPKEVENQFKNPVCKKTWNVVYPKDAFTDDAMLDLRYLNEQFAGEHGFIRQSKDGESFVRADGKPIRFWAANVSDQTARKGLNHLDSMARYLSKIGFNMVRYHGRINPKAEGSKLEEPDSAEIHRIWRFVAAMKKQGIYATISPFWAHNGHMGGHIRKEWGLDGYADKEALWGAMYFNDKLKNAYKEWVRELYTKPNAYTGIALKDEPAVAIIQIKNEDGVFFWTMQNMNPSLRKIIEEKFATWLVAKYGSLANANTQWGKENVDGDDLSNGKVALYSTYDMTITQTGNKATRLKDQVQFYAETQRNFYREIHDFYRNELGCKQLINPNNWRTANTPRLDDLERWTNAACEVIATNRYMDPGHVGENSGWQIKAGQNYVGASVLKTPDQLPINVKLIVGKPMIITESGWNMPNKHQVEGPFMISNYQSLNGVDGFYWFSIDDIGINPKPYFNIKSEADSVSTMYRWNLSSPGTVNMMPANALSYRMGYVKQGKTVIHENRTTSALFNRELPLINEDTPFDPNRDTEFVKFDKSEKIGMTPLAFLVGKVTANYGATKNSSYLSKDLATCINTAQKRVISTTKELELDYGKGIATVNSPYSQGVCGFLNQQRTFNFKTVTIQSDNAFASIQVVSMDGKPLATSGKILIQIGTVFLSTNWSETASEFTVNKKKETGFVINDVGTMPWQGQNVDAKISINNRSVSKVTLLDAAGYAVQKWNVEKTNNGVTLTLPSNAMYLILE